MGITNAVAGVRSYPTVAILLVGGCLGFRDGLRKLLDQEPGLTVVGDVSDPQEAVRFAEAVQPLILITGFSGRPLIRMMRSLQERARAGHDARTIVLTTRTTKSHALRTLQLGPSAIPLKETSPHDLVQTIRSVTAGDRVAPQSQPIEVVAPPAQAPAAVEPPGSHTGFGLTRRELEMAAAVRRGDSNKVIARRFSISEDTVKHHLTRVYSKTGVLTRLELAVFAIEHGLGQEHGGVNQERGRGNADAPRN